MPSRRWSSCWCHSSPIPTGYRPASVTTPSPEAIPAPNPSCRQGQLCSAPLRSKAHPCSLSDEMPTPPAGVKGRTQSERGAKTGDGAEGPEATAVPTITVAAPRSDPGRRPVARADLFRPREHRTAIDRAWVDSAWPAGVAPVGDTGPGSLTTTSTAAVGPGRTPQV